MVFQFQLFPLTMFPLEQESSLSQHSALKQEIDQCLTLNQDYSLDLEFHPVLQLLIAPEMILEEIDYLLLSVPSHFLCSTILILLDYPQQLFWVALPTSSPLPPRRDLAQKRFRVQVLDHLPHYLLQLCFDDLLLLLRRQ